MKNEFALSPSQNRILLAELANPGTPAYNLYFSMRFAYEDESALLSVIPKIMKGSFSLRVRSAGEKGYAQYYSEEDAGWETLDLPELDETAATAKIDELKQTAIAPLFDAPLYRLYILRVSGSVIFFGAFHHLISDGTTLNQVLPERLAAGIEAVKQGKDCEESGESYREYIRRVTEYLASSESEEDRSYWINELHGFQGAGYKAETLAKGISLQEIPEEITAAWLPFQKEQHISPFVLSLGAVFAYYQGLRAGLGSADREMVWEISVNGRYFGDDLAHECGMFVETLPLRLSWDGKKTFAELLMDIKAVMKAGLIHARTGSNAYFPELQKQGVDLRSLTSFSIVDNGLSGAAAEGGFQSELETGSETDVPFHVRVNLNRDNRLGVQTLTFEYNSDIFREEDILEIRDGVTDVLRQASLNSNISLEELKVRHSRLIASECLVEKNLAAADEPVSLQCGAPRGASFERKTDAVSAALSADRETLTAGLMALMVRFGMTKEILIGIRGEEEVLPFGMKVDTSMAAAAFKKAIGGKLEAYEEAWQYPLSCRTDVTFDPGVVLSFAAPSGDSGKEETTGADITVYFAEHSLEIAYDASRYTDKYMASFITALRKLCAAMESDTPLKEIPLSDSKKEKHSIVLKNEGTINGILERMASEDPDQTVLTACDRSMTLSELDREANRIGNALLAKGIKRGDRVLLLMRRTSSLVACVFGVLKAGAAFIPMDPNYPKDRIHQILEDSKAALIITDVSEAAEGFSNCISPAELLSGNDECPGIAVTPDDLCFIIYTSGTTGRPKGVALSHRGISNYIAPEAENTPIYAIARRCSGMLCLSSVSFIVFLREIFGTILNGVHVVLCDEEQMVNPMVIAELVKQYGIDALGATPTRLLQYTEIPAFCEALRGIRVMVVGGEGFPGRLFRVIREYSDCEIYNSYGPTEVTIASHQKRMDSERVSAGFPMLNVWDRIADVDGGELPPYAVGELYVGGAGVAIGYFNNEELTASRFPTIDGERYCNTGDLAYRNDTGEVFVLGRNDGMIKLRGLRIELEEIENTLGRYPGVTQARVIVKNIQGTEHLCAFYTVSSGKENITADRLRDFVLEKLPPYMAPTYYTCLEAFPLTPNGKVAMKLLKELPVDTKARAVLERPETDTQKAVFAITASLIESEQFGIRDDLFSLGLTSLSMIALVSEIYEKFGQPIQVTELMKHRTVEGIAQLIDELAAQSPEADSQKHFVKTCPVTANQLGIYFDCTAHPESVGYHLPNVIRFDRSVDPEKLRDAVVKMVNHHPYLKVIFDMQGGEVVQLRDDARPFDVPVEHVSAFTDQMAEELAAQPFGLTGELLFRFKIFVTDEEVALFSLFHHLIVDGGSLNLVFSDIAAAYDGRPLLKEDCDGYRLSEVEKSAEGSAAWAQDIAFFKEQFSVVEEATALTANQKGSEESGSLGVANAEVDIAAVEELCRKYHVSENVVFMSAMAVTLTKFNSDDKLLLATVSNGRLSPMVRNTVALMVKTLPLALKPDRSIKIPELFEYCSGVWMNTLSHQTYPFAKLSGDYDFHPDFFYTYHGKIYEEIELGGRKWKRDRIRYDSLRYKVMLNVIEEDRFIIRAEYNDAIYSADYMQTFVESIGKVIGLWDASENLAGLRICDISLGGEDIEYHFHPLKVEMVHQTFEEMAAAYPDRPILTCRSETYTYDEMNRRANRIAHALMKRGVREGGSVVLLMHRTADLIISMMAVMKAGAAYIPMDVEYPEERVQYVIEDADADLVITEKDLPKAVSVQELLRETDESNPPIRVDGERTAYMIYTSGSTGRPKGVEVSHRNLSNLCVPDPENNYFYTRTPMPESVVQTATVSFDASILDIMPPLLNGMRLIFADDEENRNAEQLTKLIRKEKPAVLGDMTASKLQQFLQSPSFAGELHRFAACAVGGEAFMPALYDKIRSLSDLDIYNSYGPTETTVHSNTRIIQKENIMSVGRGLYNVQCDIRDIDGKVLPDGVVGEHYIGGYGVSKGYHNQPEKTAASFLSIGGVRYFRSGDFAYKLPNGEIVVLGRRDGQIKLRGLRIEIGEIEQSMLAYPDVKAAAVIIRKINRTEHLCGYYTSESDVDEDRFREFLASRLTPYMVPTVLMRLASMPYTPNGKLDRRNLPEPELKRNYVAPCNDVETFFCNVFEEALELEQVGAKDDFFTIGGTSLLAIQVTILASNGGYNIKFRDVFEHPTPRELAEFVSGDTVRSGESNEISDYDYTAIHRYLEGNTFERVLTGERRPLKRILLTGATGFLGSHILRELLEHTDAVVYCLVRSGSMPGAKRLINKLFYYFDNDYADLLGGRLMVVEGEITDAESLKKLEELELDAVYNCAASVKHFSAGTDIFDTNVLGVRNVLMLAEKMNMRMIHISTTSTAGEILLDGRHETFVYDERTLFKGQALDNQYLSSKFLAEREVLAAAARGQDAKVIRVGNLMARDEDGIFQINFQTNGFINRLKAYATLGVMPFDKMLQKLEMSPIDITAQAIVRLAGTPKECSLFNCKNNHTITFGDLLKAANDSGIKIRPVTQDVFREKMDEAMRDKDMQQGIGGLISTVGMGTSAERALTEVSNAYTTMVLFNEGVYWPVITEEYLTSFFEFLNELAFWGKKKQDG